MNLDLKRVTTILLIYTLFLSTQVLLADKRDGIELPEMVITGEDQSRLTREEKKEEFLIPEREKIGLEKESAKEALPGQIVKREKLYLEEEYPLSFFELSYGSYNTLDYRLVSRQRREGIDYLLSLGGGFSDGFDWEETSSFGRVSRHHLEGEVGLHRQGWGVGGAVDYGIRKISLPYGDVTEDISAGGVRLGGVMSISPKADIGAGVEFAGGNMREEDISSTKLTYNLEFNTLMNELPIGIGARMEHSLIEQEVVDIYRLFAQSKGISLDPFRMDIRAGVDNHKDQRQELNLGLSLSWPWREGRRLFLEYERRMENPSFKDLYLENDYVIPNKELLPLRRGELRLGVDYRYSKEAFFDLVLFTKDLRDYAVLKEERDHLYTPANIDASIWGLEMGLKSRLADHLTQSSSLVYTSARSREEDGVVPFVPDWRASLLLRYLNERGFEASLNPEYVSRQKDGLLEETYKKLPSYFLLNARLAQHLFKDSLSVFLYGKNLFNEEYKERYHYPGWPATFGGGFIWRF